ncbi:MAG: type II toxin-antitoxin system HigB family toxin [Gammaproteobacteria bacterium]|nr:type II toxin-antitoxin system HigB family toxin [Gammaproteobacteria bacterium]
MRVIGLGILHQFCDDHADCRDWIENWVTDAQGCIWQTPQDIKDRYPSASFLAEGIVIFNVRGNRYRLEVRLAYQMGVVKVRWIGTHAEYDQRHR